MEIHDVVQKYSVQIKTNMQNWIAAVVYGQVLWFKLLMTVLREKAQEN